MPKFQCALASAERAEPIFATASQVRRWLLVEVGGSWGRDAVADTALGGHVTDRWRDAMRTGDVRVVVIRRNVERAAAGSMRVFFVETGDGPRRAGHIWRRTVRSLADVTAITHDLPRADGPGDGWIEHPGTLLLVCTNGKHDACCATFGRPLVRALRDSAHADDVWECSHIGGDRFAGNLVILPEGLYFGRCAPADGPSIVDAFDRGLIDLDHYRGRSTLGFMAQAAEFFTRRELGLDTIDAVRAVRRVGEPSAGTFAVDVVDEPDHPATVAVTVRRTMGRTADALTCRGPTDLELPRYELVDLIPAR